MECKAINKNLIEVVNASDLELKQLKLLLTKRIDGWRWHPKVKAGHWDGRITKLQRNKYFSFGLWHYVKSMMKEYDIDVSMKNISYYFDHEVDFEEFQQFCYDIMDKHPSITPYDYQIETAFKFLKFKKATAELATSAGKTLVAWLFYSWLLEKNEDFKILMVVPKVDLVTQAYEDFMEYNQGQRQVRIQEIYSGARQIRGEPNIVIGTYQSLSNRKKEFFKDYNLFLVDETHMAKTKSILSIVKKLQHTDYRFGMSGTLPRPTSIDYLTIMEATGPTVNKVTVNDLEEDGRTTPARIGIVRMNYLDTDKRMKLYNYYEKGGDHRKKVFNLEREIVIKHPKRLKYVTNVINKSTKNSLVLFYRRDHGKAIYNRLKEISNDKEIYYIDGSTPKDNREVIKAKMKQGSSKILVASFQIFSTGISIKNLHNIFLTESYKSEIIIKQTIGRGLRKLKGKDFVTIIDFVDDFRLRLDSENIRWNNYLWKHGKERLKIYKEEKHNYQIKDVNF